MKKTLFIAVVAFLSATAVHAQDSSFQKKKHSGYDSSFNSTDTTKMRKKWNKDKMKRNHNDKNMPDSLNRMDTLRRQDN